MRWNLSLLFIFISSTCFSQGPWLFIGTYTSGQSKGIYVYRFQPGNGTATEVSTIHANNPSYLCVGPDGKHLYATDENEKSSSVNAFAFEPSTGKLALLNSQSSLGTCACYVAEDKTGKWVFVANYCSGNLAALPVNSDGSLAPASQMIQQSGSGKDKSRQGSPHVHSTILSPNEKFLFVADLGTDKEHIYGFHPAQNKPLSETADPVVSLEPGTGPRHIAFHPKRPDVYILGELSGSIDAFHVDSSNGHLRHFQRIRTTSDSFAGDPASADIHIRGDGKFLYATNRGTSNTIAVFEIRKDGRLVQRQVISVNGNHPRNFVIDPTNKFLLVANQDSDNIVVFSINPTTGLLKPTGTEIKIPNPVCLKFLTP